MPASEQPHSMTWHSLRLLKPGCGCCSQVRVRQAGQPFFIDPCASQGQAQQEPKSVSCLGCICMALCYCTSVCRDLMLQANAPRHLCCCTVPPPWCCILQDRLASVSAVCLRGQVEAHVWCPRLCVSHEGLVHV